MEMQAKFRPHLQSISAGELSHFAHFSSSLPSTCAILLTNQGVVNAKLKQHRLVWKNVVFIVKSLYTEHVVHVRYCFSGRPRRKMEFEAGSEHINSLAQAVKRRCPILTPAGMEQSHRPLNWASDGGHSPESLTPTRLGRVSYYVRSRCRTTAAQ